MQATHIIPLQVLIPLLTAPICALLPVPRLAWAAAVCATWGAFAIALQLLITVLSFGPLSYHMGNWAPPVGIEYRVDVLNAFILTLVSGVASVMILYARKSVAVEIQREKHPAFYTVYLLCLAGLLGMAITNDAFNIYVFLEISSLATYTLIAMGKDRRALLSAFEYLILGTIGATFYLIGIGLLYMMTGTLNISDLAQRIPEVQDIRPILAAFTFLTIGLALKFALFPLHLWLCNAYTYAPSFISSFLAATATKVMLYVFIRIIFVVFGADFSFSMLPLGVILQALAVLAIFTGSLTAIFQHDVKRMLAFSSVAQIGYIIMGISLADTAGLTAATVHIFNHALAKGGLFMACGCVAARFHGTTLNHFRGMGKQMPITMLAFLICSASIIGVPLTGGFISKWVLLKALFDQGLWPLAVVLLISSLLALAYIGRVVEAAYFREHPNAAPAVTEAPFSMWLPLWVTALACLFFGIYTEYSLGIAQKAAAMLLGGNV